jgi:hypothetical protein
MPKFKKKPVIIEAVQWTGDNMLAIRTLMGSILPRTIVVGKLAGTLEIPTMEGIMTASQGDWIIRGVKGEFYPCKPDIFEATYEPVD